MQPIVWKLCSRWRSILMCGSWKEPLIVSNHRNNQYLAGLILLFLISPMIMISSGMIIGTLRIFVDAIQSRANRIKQKCKAQTMYFHFDLVKGLRTNEYGRVRIAVYQCHVLRSIVLSKPIKIKPITLSKPIKLSKPKDNQTTWWMKRWIFRGEICSDLQWNRSRK